MYMSGLAEWCTDQLTRGHNSERERTPMFWSDPVLWGMDTKHLKGKEGQQFGK